MRDITIKITGKRFVGDTVEEELEFISDGKMFDKGDAKYFIYDESEFSGFPGCKTSLKLTDKSLRMKRIGGTANDYGATLEFEAGKRFKSSYNTPYGTMFLEVLTNSIKRELSPEGFGKITLEYDVSLKGMIEGRNELAIEIMQ
ncbi:MAG: DUF1934 domain-containing protein [Eubacterium sp.]|nr:DUF1934 domain-containing protein [Eubacterium sp.]